MAQGSLKKASGAKPAKKVSAKRVSEQKQKTKIGALKKAPKCKAAAAAFKEDQALTKAINADNEEHFAAQAAAQPGSKLSVLKAPVSATADEKQRLKKSLKPGTAFGAKRQQGQ